MIALVSGRARRLVRRKYCGKEWKRIQTKGAVNTWQDKDRVAALQTFLTGSILPQRPSPFG
jgi:hypothetical protein